MKPWAPTSRHNAQLSGLSARKSVRGPVSSTLGRDPCALGVHRSGQLVRVRSAPRVASPVGRGRNGASNAAGQMVLLPTGSRNGADALAPSASARGTPPRGCRERAVEEARHLELATTAGRRCVRRPASDHGPTPIHPRPVRISPALYSPRLAQRLTKIRTLSGPEPHSLPSNQHSHCSGLRECCTTSRRRTCWCRTRRRSTASSRSVRRIYGRMRRPNNERASDRARCPAGALLSRPRSLRWFRRLRWPRRLMWPPQAPAPG
ncbi:hypothetical protein SAMN05428944_6683 [Streptomyces sp. 1222.5]|nr:hypothetical protein SAMN05428944_6683 [Streptomyces sp. 1222.5]